MAACVFCDIIAGRVPAYAVYEDDTSIGFLDRAPLMPGHVLLVPRTHVEILGDLPRQLVAPFFEAVQQLSTAVERAMKADGSFVAINIRISQSVPHLHVHIVPRRKGDGLFAKTFMWIRKPYPSDSAAREAQHAIKQALGGA